MQLESSLHIYNISNRSNNSKKHISLKTFALSVSESKSENSELLKLWLQRYMETLEVNKYNKKSAEKK